MSQLLEAEAAHIHLAGGAPRVTTPAGNLAMVAPRRAARGRMEDALFLCVGTSAAQPPTPGLLDHLARMAGAAFYGTPGSVTAALRESAVAINDYLIKLRKDPSGPDHGSGTMLACVLRGSDLYLAQSGQGQMALIRPGQVGRWSSEEAIERPLGEALTPHVSFQHLVVRAGDVILFSPAANLPWSDTTLSGLSGMDPARAVDRLSAGSTDDLSGILIRLRLAEVGATLESKGPVPIAQPTGPSPARDRREQRAQREPGIPHPLQLRMRVLRQRLQGGWSRFLQSFLQLSERLFPGFAHPGRTENISPSILAATALIVPLVVVTIASVVYLRRGRPDQFLEYLGQAQVSMLEAQGELDPALARSAYEEALKFLELAANYAENDEITRLEQQAQQGLDTLNLVMRLDFKPAVSGGFTPGARITAIAATASDLYVLDAANMTIWHAWATGRNYTIDIDFDCLAGADSVVGMGIPLDIVALSGPGPQGIPGIVALDADGSVVYCAPGTELLFGQLAAPDIGWGRIQAVDVFQDRLYILDPEKNAVWIYDASGGLFSGSPALYFAAEFVPDLHQAIDLVMAQDELLIMHADGHLDRCRRTRESTRDGSIRILADCEQELTFEDQRPGFAPVDRVPVGIPAAMAYSPPPEPSVFFLDGRNGSVLQYSLRMIYQGRYQPNEPFARIPSSMALGPLNELFLASGNQVYFANAVR